MKVWLPIKTGYIFSLFEIISVGTFCLYSGFTARNSSTCSSRRCRTLSVWLSIWCILHPDIPQVVSSSFWASSTYVNFFLKLIPLNDIAERHSQMLLKWQLYVSPRKLKQWMHLSPRIGPSVWIIKSQCVFCSKDINFFLPFRVILPRQKARVGGDNMRVKGTCPL